LDAVKVLKGGPSEFIFAFLHKITAGVMEAEVVEAAVHWDLVDMDIQEDRLEEGTVGRREDIGHEEAGILDILAAEEDMDIEGKPVGDNRDTEH
jgi:hypothetical protein